MLRCQGKCQKKEQLTCNIKIESMRLLVRIIVSENNGDPNSMGLGRRIHTENVKFESQSKPESSFIF